jgi:hypothetical protein
MVAIMDTTITPKQIMTHPRNNKIVHVAPRYFMNMIFKNNWVIRENKKSMSSIGEILTPCVGCDKHWVK